MKGRLVSIPAHAVFSGEYMYKLKIRNNKGELKYCEYHPLLIDVLNRIKILKKIHKGITGFYKKISFIRR